MLIAVAGGTGVAGRLVVTEAQAAGHQTRVLARSTGVDLRRGTGVAAALDGVDTAIDATNLVTLRKSASVDFFSAVARNLVDASRAAGLRHLVVLSIVGCDRVDYGYYFGKRAQEDIVLCSDVPATVLRTTQFHEFTGQLLSRARGPVAVIPRMRTQPVAAREAAAELVRLAVGAPLGRAPELAGPQVLDQPDLARRALAARGARRTVLPLRIPGSMGRGLAGGALLPESDGPRGTVTFDAWLAANAL
ncbi:MAG: NAD(P)H-binding protein [Mycobacteriales bacterium]